MQSLNQYLWRKQERIFILLSCFFIVIFLCLLATCLRIYKQRQLESVLQVSLLTINDSIKVGDWDLVQKNIGSNILGSDIYGVRVYSSSGEQIAGPIGIEKFGVMALCDNKSAAKNVGIGGCVKIFSLFDLVISLVFLFTIVMGFAIFFLIIKSKVNIVFKSIEQNLTRISEIENSINFVDESIVEVIEINSLFQKIKNLIAQQEQLIRLKASFDIAQQVSHDIRSPLSALSMIIGTLKEIPEEKRLLIRNATQRINDIANDLLQKGKEDHSPVASSSTNVIPTTSTEFIPVIIDILVSEKRMQFREHSGLEIEVDLKDSFGSFAQINSNELKRVISNLVNNAVEAFQNHQGRITVGVRKITAANNQKVEIFVKDNGRGIPKHILEKLGQMGVTHGKEGTQSGSGLGVYHAKKTAESFGGTFEIDSVEGKGTTIRIILPLAEPPTWFANKIDLSAKKYLIISR